MVLWFANKGQSKDTFHLRTDHEGPEGE